MSTALICDNAYQLHLGEALNRLGLLPDRVGALVSLGDTRLSWRARGIAEAASWRHVHVGCAASFWAQVGCAVALRLAPPKPLREAINGVRAIVIFNDTHPCTVQLRKLFPSASVTLVEEGTGLHRTRHIDRWLPRRWLGRLLVPGLTITGRQGESPWVDQLWVSQDHALTPAQRQKPIVMFDRRAAITEMRRAHGIRADLPADGRPVLLVLGQPFVEDGVLTRARLRSMLDAVATAIGHDDGAMMRAYKPHPRERQGAHNAAHVLGPGATILDQYTPLELLDFNEAPVLLLTFASSAARQGAANWRCVSLAPCFPLLAGEIGDERTFPGVTFLRELGELAAELTPLATSNLGRQPRVARGLDQ